MRDTLNSLLRPNTAPSLLEVVGGTLVGITLTYLFFYAGEILNGTHHIDFSFLSFLVLLGIPVLALGWWQTVSAEREGSRN